MDAKTSVRRINSIFRVLNRFAIQNCAQLVVLPGYQLERSSARLHRGSQSPSEASRSNPRRIATERAPSRKRNVDTTSESTQRKKRRLSGGGAGSSGSALTTLTPRRANRDELVEDNEKFAKIQEDFWRECFGCYLFGMATYEVDIAQCILGRDEYIIRKLQPEIVKSVKAELIQIGDTQKDVEVDIVLEVGSHAHGASTPIDIVNLSDVESDDGKHLIGDLSDESDHDDEGVDQGISVPAPPMATIAPSVDSSQSPTVPPMMGESAMQQLQNSAEPVEGDTFRNAAGKAPHPDAIVWKVESGWWAKRELKKKLKAEQKAVVELELMCLKEQNFILMKQLAMQGNVPSVVSLSAVPQVGSNDVGVGNIMAGLATVDGGTTSNIPPPERGPMLSLILNTLADSAKDGGGVLRVEDRSAPSIPVIESQEDSLQFHFEVEMEVVKQSHYVLDVESEQQFEIQVGEAVEEVQVGEATEEIQVDDALGNLQACIDLDASKGLDVVCDIQVNLPIDIDDNVSSGCEKVHILYHRV